MATGKLRHGFMWDVHLDLRESLMGCQRNQAYWSLHDAHPSRRILSYVLVWADLWDGHGRPVNASGLSRNNCFFSNVVKIKNISFECVQSLRSQIYEICICATKFILLHNNKCVIRKIWSDAGALLLQGLAYGATPYSSCMATAMAASCTHVHKLSMCPVV